MGTCWREQVDEGLGQREERRGYGSGVPCGCCGEGVVVVVSVVSILAQDQSSEAPQRPSWHLAQAQSLLGEALARSGHLDLARPRLEEAAEVLRAELGEQHLRTRRALERLEWLDGRLEGEI